MKFAFGGNIDLMGFFWRFKRPKIHRLFLDANIRLPVISVASNAKQPGFRSFLRAAPVMRVHFCCRCPKIVYSVVIAHTVYMVDKFGRLFSVIVKPCQTMRPMASAKHENAEIPTVMSTAGLVSNFYPLRNFFAPVKFACIGVIVEHISNMFRRYFHRGRFPTYDQHRHSIA